VFDLRLLIIPLVSSKLSLKNGVDLFMKLRNNGQKKKDKQINNDLPSITQKTED
jgi:hypothetical protein